MSGGATGQSTPTRDQTRARSDAMNNMLADEQVGHVFREEMGS